MPLARPAKRPLFVSRFVRLLPPRRGLLKGSRFGVESAVRFLRKVVRRIVRAVLACAEHEGDGDEWGECV